jgi:hypothetical protein
MVKVPWLHKYSSSKFIVRIASSSRSIFYIYKIMLLFHSLGRLDKVGSYGTYLWYCGVLTFDPEGARAYANVLTETCQETPVLF